MDIRLPDAHVALWCQAGHGPATCAFLMRTSLGFQCAKTTDMEPEIRHLIARGTLNAKGDNCSGPPDFISPP